ncbi:serine hydrolase domain-containing protein [Chitinophaga sp. NPDC101104]|uniref:serine hydrolase domain-containing protein n=1 Tax=Chitinophaga sp. NPDC101104 TaxID=3390561 RepID=UPI003CFE8A5D
MKHVVKPFACCAIAVVTLAGLNACKKEPPIQSNDKKFSTSLFKKNLQEALASARGYQFVITQNGQVADTAAYGIQSIDGKKSDLHAFTNIASVTKTLTAATVVQYMLQKDVTIESKIGRWLPASWYIHDSIRNITFKQLMTHTSGIRGSQTDWEPLMSTVASPITAPKTPEYSNINFALFRAILPKLNDSVKFRQQEQLLAPGEFRKWMSQEYIRLVNVHVLSKAGIPARGCAPVEGKMTQMMSEAPYRLIGSDFGNWTEKCGGGGWVLTTMEMSRIIVYLTHTNNILSPEERQLMDDNRLGWIARFPVTGGLAYGHDGALYVDRNKVEGLNWGDVGSQTLIIRLPAKVELAMGINSLGADWRKVYDIVALAYNKSWK